MQVAIDTSTETASLALVQDGKILVELTWHTGQNHTTQLLPYLSHLLEQTKSSLKAVDGIIVAIGPGSYNGLRVGLGTAKGLSFALGIPIVGMSTLEAEAYQHAATGLPVCPIFNAARGEIATAIFQEKGHRWVRRLPEQITTIDILCSGIQTKTLFCGEFVSTVAAELTQRLGRKALMLSPVAGLRRAGFLAELGLKRFKAGDYDNPITLQPLYLRGVSITQPKHPF